MDTRTHIINTAYDLFIKKGYHRTTTRDIALAADVNLGLIPYYFGKKNNLGVEVYSIMLERIGQQLDLDLIPLNNPLEELYYKYLMLQYYLMVNESVYQFYTEFLESCDLQLSPHIHTSTFIQKASEFYKLNLTNEEVIDYHSILIGAERSMISKKSYGNFSMSYFEINATLSRILFRLIGIDNEKAESAIQYVNKNIINLPFDWSIFD